MIDINSSIFNDLFYGINKLVSVANTKKDFIEEATDANRDIRKLVKTAQQLDEKIVTVLDSGNFDKAGFIYTGGIKILIDYLDFIVNDLNEDPHNDPDIEQARKGVLNKVAITRLQLKVELAAAAQLPKLGALLTDVRKDLKDKVKIQIDPFSSKSIIQRGQFSPFRVL